MIAIDKQGQRLLEHPRHLFLLALVFSLLPYTQCLALVLIALITLRKGLLQGAFLMLPVMLVHFSLSLRLIPGGLACLNTVLSFVPCYLAAAVLSLTLSWRAVVAVFVLQVLCVGILLQGFVPDFFAQQAEVIRHAIQSSDPDHSLDGFLQAISGNNATILGHVFFGIQAFGLVFSATLSLMMARALQARWYYPGGFKKEFLSLRCDKIDLALLALVIAVTLAGFCLAIDVLPTMIFFTLLVGLSIATRLLAGKSVRGVAFLLVIPILVLPFFAVPAYLALAVLDVFFDFRTRFSGSIKK